MNQSLIAIKPLEDVVGICLDLMHMFTKKNPYKHK